MEFLEELKTPREEPWTHKKLDPKTVRPITPEGKVVTKRDEAKKITPEGKIVTP